MAYSNVTPPTLPEYDAAANPYYLIQFEYAIGAEDWETVRFWYGAAPLTWNGEAVTNSADCYCQTYGTGSPEWTYWGVMAAAGEMALTPGESTVDTYMRLYTNHDILDGTGAVWLAAGKVTPTEEDKEAEIQIRIKSKLAGIIAAWCAPVRQFPKPTAEPVAFLYNGVRLPRLPESDLQFAFIYKLTSTYTVVFTNSYEFGSNSENVFWHITVPDGNQAYMLTSANEWRKLSSTSAREVNYEYIIWANFDVPAPSGEVYLAASAPVPVYE